MDKIGIFQVTYEKQKKKTKKRYLFLDSFLYTSNLDFIKKTKDYLKRYANLNNIILLEFDEKKDSYITYNTSRKEVELKEIKDKIQ